MSFSRALLGVEIEKSRAPQRVQYKATLAALQSHKLGTVEVSLILHFKVRAGQLIVGFQRLSVSCCFVFRASVLRARAATPRAARICW